MIGTKLSDRYEILAELGHGGMGVVYQARDPRLDREVAIKLISPSLVTPETEQRFHSEAQVVARMDHPNIVPIYDFGHHEGSLFFVMPILLGMSLRHAMREGSLRLGEVIDVGVQVAQALEYSHARGVVHRDIKPENVMISREKTGGLRARVMDFGLAHSRNVSRLTRTGQLVGTVSYVSPEQISADPVDGRADIYALGIVLYECVTHEVPFSGEVHSVLYRIVHEIPRSPSEQGADIDEELDTIILRCLAKDPDKRPQQAGELVGVLQTCRSRLTESEEQRPLVSVRSLATARPAPSPFVGRQEETRTLQQRLNLALEGQCQFVVISGEAGVGKTRILEELEKLATARQIRVLHGRFVEQEASFPYHGFCEAIQDYFQRKESDSDVGSGVADFSDLAADLVSLFPMLSEIEAMRSAVGSDALIRPGKPSSPGHAVQIFELLAKTLTRMAGGRPLVLFLEELHAGRMSIEALQYIVRRLGPTPTLIVGTFRSTEIDRRHPLTKMLAGFRGDRLYASISLTPFPPAEHHSFLRTIVGGSDVVDGLAEQLYEASEGNPFLTRELVRSLLDSGSIVQNEHGAWTLSGKTKISYDALPATIQEAVAERVERLPEDLREVLSLASVMGKTFDFRDLETLAGPDIDLDDAVDRLIQEGLILERRQARGDRLTFSSGVVRDVFYASVSRRRRRALHRKYAGHLEKRHAGRLEGIYPQLVHHFAEGDVPEKTVKYGLLQAQKSLDAFSPDEAIRSSRTALDFLDSEWEGERSTEGEARTLLASALEMSGEVHAALRELEAATRVYEREGQPDLAVSAILRGARAAWRVRRIEDTGRWVERGLAAARAAGEAENLREFLSLAATLATLRGAHGEANEFLREAEQLAPHPAGSEATEEIPRGGKLVAAFAVQLALTEPSQGRLVEETEIYSNVFETLLRTGKDGNLVAGLCEEWEEHDDGKAFHFKLRPGIRFHDGAELTAASVKESLERACRGTAGDVPPALAVIRGASRFLEGQSEGMEGIVLRSDGTLEIQLDGPLSIFPALLTDYRVSITRAPAETGDDRPSLVGTGPFRLTAHDDQRVVLEANPDYWKGDPPRVDAVEFRHGLSSPALASGLRSGDLDIVGDLSPRELELLLREPRFRRSMVEIPEKTTYFVLFNCQSGGVAADPAVRRALCGVLRAHALVWKTVGRFAQPAVCLLPPGILGHDPGRRRPPVSLEEAQEILRSAGLGEGIELRAAVHPLYQDRYETLLKAVFAVWAELGVQVSIQTHDITSFLDAQKRGLGIDVLIMRWLADYDDPDNVTHSLFHSATGLLGSYYSCPEADEILEAARVENRAAVRESLYRKFETLLQESGALVPLFHDIDCRIASPAVRGLRLESTPPWVNYAELGKAETVTAAKERSRKTSGILRVPMAARLQSLDPSLTETAVQSGVLPSIYETLMRYVAGTQLVPWLVAEFTLEAEGRRYRFVLRDGVRFHDGRRVTARDVRYSFERLLQNGDSAARWMFSPILGAGEILAGEARDLTGFHIHSVDEFSIELDKPVSFFLGSLAYPAASIVPEGTDRIGGSASEGAVGTGPFRVARFEPGRHLELVRNPTYWREGYPRTQELAFSFGVPPPEIVSGFRAGRFSLASDLLPQDAKGLRRDPDGASYAETPALSTLFAAFNVHRGPTEDRVFRRKIAKGVDIAGIVRRTLGRFAMPARGYIPPGLLGYEPGHGAGRPAGALPDPETLATEVELSAAVHPIFTTEYATFFEGFSAALRRLGVRLRKTTSTMAEYLEASRHGRVDLMLGRWIADYPDADSFAYLLHSQEGSWGRMCGTPKVERLIERGRAEMDPDLRHGIYREFEAMLAHEAILLPFFHEQIYRFARPEVSGLSVDFCHPVISYEEMGIRDH